MDGERVLFWEAVCKREDRIKVIVGVIVIILTLFIRREIEYVYIVNKYESVMGWIVPPKLHMLSPNP